MKKIYVLNNKILHSDFFLILWLGYCKASVCK